MFHLWFSMTVLYDINVSNLTNYNKINKMRFYFRPRTKTNPGKISLISVHSVNPVPNLSLNMIT